MATRQGDRLVGLAMPNSIALGNNQVLIGDLACGMLLPSVMDVFFFAMAELMSAWDGMSPVERLLAIEKLVNATVLKGQLDIVKVTRVTIVTVTLRFSWSKGALEISDKLLTAPKKMLDAKALHGALARESRRAEQLYALTDKLVSGIKPIPDWVPPTWVEKVKKAPINAGDPLKFLGEALDNSMQGPAKVLRQKKASAPKGTPTPNKCGPHAHGSAPDDKSSGFPEDEDAFAVGKAYEERYEALQSLPKNPKELMSKLPDAPGVNELMSKLPTPKLPKG